MQGIFCTWCQVYENLHNIVIRLQHVIKQIFVYGNKSGIRSIFCILMGIEISSSVLQIIITLAASNFSLII